MGNAGVAKALLMLGGPTTATVDVAAGAVGDSLEVSPLVILFFTPGAVPVTFTTIVQFAPAASVAPVRLMLEPAAVVTPVHPVMKLATDNPAGNTSLNVMPVRVVVSRLEIVKVNTVVLPIAIWVGANCLVNVGAIAAAPGRHGLAMVVPYWAALPKLLVSPALSLPKLNTQAAPEPTWLQNG